MNDWFERYTSGLPDGATLALTREEAALLLDLAGAAARSSGARPYAPLATWLAGRAAGTAPVEQRLALLRAAAGAAAAAGAGEPLDIP